MQLLKLIFVTKSNVGISVQRQQYVSSASLALYGLCHQS